MTDAQFTALAALMHMHGGASREAARLVMVDGLIPAEAARQAGTTQQATSNALAKCRRGVELARQVVGHGDTP